MQRALLSPLALSAIALCFTPQFALSGPVPWSYQVEISGPFVSFGVEQQVWIDPVTGEDGVTAYHMLGRVECSLTGSASGPQTIHANSLGISDLQPYPVDDPWALNRPSRFVVQVSITDTPSGESQVVEFGGFGSSNGFFLSGTGVVNLSLEEGMQDFVLGGNRYSVSPRVQDSESAASILLDVNVVHTSPEPGTLALVGIGLCGMGVVRRLRKR